MLIAGMVCEPSFSRLARFKISPTIYSSYFNFWCEWNYHLVPDLNRPVDSFGGLKWSIKYWRAVRIIMDQLRR